MEIDRHGDARRRVHAVRVIAEIQISMLYLFIGYLSEYLKLGYIRDSLNTAILMNPFPAHPLLSGEQLGQVLRSTRKRLKLSQATIGAKLDLSQNRISYLELHPEELSLKQLLSWCSALGLELKLGARAAAPARSSAPEW